MVSRIWFLFVFLDSNCIFLSPNLYHRFAPLPLLMMQHPYHVIQSAYYVIWNINDDFKNRIRISGGDCNYQTFMFQNI